HELCTVLQTVSLADILTFTENKKIEFATDSSVIPLDADNLIVRAVDDLRERCSVDRGAKIFLEKRIPSPGGLGGGSSNAAVTLIGLCRLWQIHPDPQVLHELAASLGSDVPFFLEGGTCFGVGRGTEITLLPDFVSKFIAIVTPQIDVPTPEAFKSLPPRNLTSADSKSILHVCRSEVENVDFYTAELGNDFEKSMFARFPEIELAKFKLLDYGARTALLSGSGASVFGIFDSDETRQAALKALDEHVNWRKFAVTTISRNEYREALGVP
ncbi:MAG: 4-(cytidine 5'-diphospho)-2-C-methyl-D-erythritol kinase, partial [Acidobacteria bacterium]|nr:4-(cytidine 5'-diphospho)-2-C-methyl-D-erythritol kinase [Acidobacteriota bacterium]